MHKISFITTCKGRLHHVQQTLPLLVNVPQAEVIFVDYGCPDQSGAWVQKNHPSVQVVFVNDDPGFCLPRARNAGAQKASNPWLFFVDADIVVKPALAAWLQGDLSASKIYKSSSVNGVRDPQTWGSFLCHHNVFKQVGGYDASHYTQVVNISHLSIKGAIKWAGHNRSCRALTWETRG